MLSQVQKLRRVAQDLLDWSEKNSSLEVLSSSYGIGLTEDTNPEYYDILLKSVGKLPMDLVRDCKIARLGFEDMGESREYYPNHGKYIEGGTLILNERLFDDSSMEVDSGGRELNKFDQTFYHELGHGWDVEQAAALGFGEDLSLRPEWLELSGWSNTPIPGHRRMVIREKGTPVLKDDWYYSPNAGFTRFYAKRNPWDDWADSFAYYVSGLKSFLPENKIKYFDNKLQKYYKGQVMSKSNSLKDTVEEVAARLAALGYVKESEVVKKASFNSRYPGGDTGSRVIRERGTRDYNPTISGRVLELPKGWQNDPDVIQIDPQDELPLSIDELVEAVKKYRGLNKTQIETEFIDLTNSQNKKDRRRLNLLKGVMLEEDGNGKYIHDIMKRNRLEKQAEDLKGLAKLMSTSGDSKVASHLGSLILRIKDAATNCIPQSEPRKDAIPSEGKISKSAEALAKACDLLKAKGNYEVLDKLSALVLRTRTAAIKESHMIKSLEEKFQELNVKDPNMVLERFVDIIKMLKGSFEEALKKISEYDSAKMKTLIEATMSKIDSSPGKAEEESEKLVRTIVMMVKNLDHRINSSFSEYNK